MDKYIEIEFDEPNDFLKIKETLTRIGVVATYSNTLWQTCHILHKRKKYYILHFKELLEIDGKLKSNISQSDLDDRNFIVHFLESINLCKAVSKYEKNKLSPGHLKILKSGEKKDWELKSKYVVGDGISGNF